VIAIYKGDKYKVFNSGKVEDSNGTQIVSTGGMDALHDYLKNLYAPQYKVYNIEGKKFFVYFDGHVTTPEGELVLTSGGID